jgi:hypothetical protein
MINKALFYSVFCFAIREFGKTCAAKDLATNRHEKTRTGNEENLATNFTNNTNYFIALIREIRVIRG